MTQPATLDQVAALAGVSRSTASRVINGGVASAQAAAAVRDAVRRLGFVPNRAARDLARQKTDAIAVVIPETPAFIFYDTFLALATPAISAQFWKAGLQPMLCLMDPADPAPTAGRFLHAGNVDGIVVMSYHENPAIEELLLSSGLPAVFIGRPPTDRFPYVNADNRRGAYLATKHLLDRGRRRIACLGGSLAMTAAVDRRQGWLDAHEEAGVAPGPFLEGSFATAWGRAGADALLRDYPETDAIFAQADAVAAGAIQALTAAGKAVPGDIALVGFDDFPTATEVCPNLTTVAQPVAELAEAAAELLIGYLRDGAWPPWPRLLPTELVIRDSA
jgi:DNA-binding LacI/PurR family transcriptional regulator